MRLFIAVNFDDITKQQLTEVQCRLRKYSLCGSFTAQENLHLTLVFLGETAQIHIPAIIEAINFVKFDPFCLCIKGIGRFRNCGDDTLWIGIEANRSLTMIHDELVDRLKFAGFEIEKRKFTPHITLARRAQMNDDFNPALISQKTTAIYSDISKISLMKSEQAKNGRMIYTEM